ncbi:MAG: thioredoxin family protein [Planctomycetota bacterium]|jgi:thioredoxin 1
MNKIAKIAVVLILILAAGVVIVLKENYRTNSESQVVGNSIEKAIAKQVRPAETDNPKIPRALPLLLDFGASKCIPCKMMAPVLEELKKDYTGTFNVEFIDVWKNPDEAKKYGIKIIPTQIFFDVAGKELFRHEGYFSKADILAKWKQLNVNLEKRQE